MADINNSYLKKLEKYSFTRSERLKNMMTNSLDNNALIGMLKYKVAHAWDKSKEKRIEVIGKSVEGLASNPQFADIKNARFLNPDFLMRLTDSQLGNIATYLSKCHSLSKTYESKFINRTTPISPHEVGTKKNYESAINCYKQTIMGLEKNITSLETLKVYGMGELEQNMEDAGLGERETRDLDVIRALEFTGTTLKKQLNPTTNKEEWVVDEEQTKLNQNGLPLDTNTLNLQFFKLDKNQVNQFCENYLNVPYENRGGVITPEGIFRLYLEESKPQMKGFSRSERHDINESFEEASKIYSTNSPEWQRFCASSDQVAKLDATKSALIDLFKGEIEPGKTQIVPKKVQQEIESNNLVNEKASNKVIDIAESYIEASDNEINDPEKFAGLEDLSHKYEVQLEQLTNLLQNPNLSSEERLDATKKMEAVEKAAITYSKLKDFVSEVSKELVSDVKIQNPTISKKETRDKLLDAIRNMGDMSFVDIQESTDGESYVVIDKNNSNYQKLPKNIQEVLESTVQLMYTPSNAAGVDAKEMKEDTKLTNEEVLRAVCTDIHNSSGSNPFGDAFERKEILDRTESLLSSDNEFSRSVNSFRKNNPQATMADLVKELKKSMPNMDNALFTEESLKIANSNNPNDLNLKRSINNNADMYYVLMDRVHSELDKMIESGQITKDDINSDILSDVYNRVAPTVNPTSPTHIPATESERNIAKGKYEKLYHDMSTQHALSEMNNDPSFDNMKLKKDFVQKYGENIQKIDEANNQNSINAGDNQPSRTKEVVRKFSEKYPRRNDVSLMKKFKPYCGKTTEKTLESIMKMIEGIKIKDIEIIPIDQFVAESAQKENNNPQTESSNEAGLNVNDTSAENNSTNNTNSAQNDTQIQTEKSASATTTNAEQSTKNETQAESSAESKDDRYLKAAKELGISDGEFATYLLLDENIKRLLYDKGDLKNNKDNYLNQEEQVQLDKLHGVFQFITSESTNEVVKGIKQDIIKKINEKSVSKEQKDESQWLMDMDIAFNELQDTYGSLPVKDAKIMADLTEMMKMNNSKLEKLISGDQIRGCVKEMANMDNLKLGGMLMSTTDRTNPVDNRIGNLLDKQTLKDISAAYTTSDFRSFFAKYTSLNGEITNNIFCTMSSKMQQEYEKAQAEEQGKNEQNQENLTSEEKERRLAEILKLAEQTDFEDGMGI